MHCSAKAAGVEDAVDLGLIEAGHNRGCAGWVILLALAQGYEGRQSFCGFESGRRDGIGEVGAVIHVVDLWSSVVMAIGFPASR